MADITISLSKKNMRLLIEHVFIANWVLCSTKVQPDKELENFFDTMLGIGKNYNIIDGLDYDKETNRYFFTEEKEEDLMARIEEYDEETFWNDLSDKLAERDLFKKFTDSEVVAMEPTERMRALWKEEEKYNEEFEKFGLERLEIRK